MAEEDPLRKYNFTLFIEGLNAGNFVECSGIGADVDVIAYREGGANLRIRHLPGQTRYRPMTLRYGLSRSQALWDWFQESTAGDPARRNISVVMFSNDGASEAFRWNLFDSWVTGWSAAPFDASSGEVSIDEMIVVYDRMERD